MSSGKGGTLESSMGRGSSLPPDAGISTDRMSPSIPKGGGKMIAVKVLMLDDNYTLFQIQPKALAGNLLALACKQLHLIESDYFGLEYTDGNTRYWIDLDKPVNRQVCLSQVEPVLRFSVKFYTPDPAQLEEEYTRYLFALQIKRDLSHGELFCTENTAALLASFIVQAECGDYAEEDYPDHRYLSLFKFIPTQNSDLEKRIMDNHQRHVGMSPGAADLNLLETARRCELYGIKMHSAKDHENVTLNLAVAHMGILVFQACTKINTFSWAKIRKISFKRKKFLIKLHPEGYGYFKDVVEFFFDGRNECKNFWKKCVEHHGFFRCSAVKKLPRQKTRVISRGSSFRYSGRTQKQVQEYLRDNYTKRGPFQRKTCFPRSQSFRHSPANAPPANVGLSVSAAPLLPLASNQCVGTPASLSCGSMTLTSTADAQSPGSPSRLDAQEYDPRELETPTDTSIHSSPHRNNYVAGKSSSPVRGTPTPFLQSQQRTVKPTVVEANGNVPTIPIHEPSENAKPLKKEESFEDTTISSSYLKSSEYVTDNKKRKGGVDKAYYIIKELLTTERTYKKDLEVINVWFYEAMQKEQLMNVEFVAHLFEISKPINEFHYKLVKDLDNRLTQWDGRTASPNKEAQKIGDIFLKNIAMLQLYGNYFEEHFTLLEGLESELRRNKEFEQAYREFESEKVCYLPMTSFILKPLHRLQHYLLIFTRLCEHLSSTAHPDIKDCLTVKTMIQQSVSKMIPTIALSENFVKLLELQRDLIGIENLVQPGREFLREGCLQKLSRKGYQQRMFFLFNDVLLYTNRTSTPNLQFKVHGQLSLTGVMVEENESRMGASNCFTIYGGNRALMVAANSEEDKDRWMKDLSEAISIAKSQTDSHHLQSLKSISVSDEILDKNGLAIEDDRKTEKMPQTRSNTTVHVCWHRASSVSASDYHQAVQNQLSGYLLRKFKNSTGWQKLWVVFTNFCLFFYKTFQDDHPLASLPLLGYCVCPPGEDDQIQKEYVFKLKFKNHVYFFRAESEYTYSRWMDVISSATRGAAMYDSFKEGLNNGRNI